MFKVGAPEEVLDPYEWLPGYGESSVSLMSSGTDLSINIFSESENNSAIWLEKSILFSGVSAFYKSAFPGAQGLINIHYMDKWEIGSLIEFKVSEVADAWNSYLGRNSSVKHYLIQFMSENIQVHVIAEGFNLREKLHD